MSTSNYTPRLLATKSIEILDRCLNLQDADDQKSARQVRSDDLIAEFELCEDPFLPRKAFDQSWYFCVPTSFRAALDIRQGSRIVDGTERPVWTQGPWFDFSAGDTIYDSVKAYGTWNLGSFNICLAIQHATPTQSATESKPRSHGSVIFDILTPDKYRSKLIVRRQKALDQNEFVRLLILGPPPEWNEFLVDS